MSQEQIRFGVIGTNKITDWFIESAKQIEAFQLTAVYSRSEEKATEFADKYQVPYRFSDLRAMAESDVIDAVYIASPNALHAEQSILFLNNKKHVLCEKAFASNAAEVREMIETARLNHMILMEAMISTQMPNFKAVQKHLPRLGKIRRYCGVYCQYSSRYDSYKEGMILNAFRPELSNGSLMDIGVYCIHPMIYLFGKPDRIKADAIMLESGVDGEGSMICSYKDMQGIAIYSKITNSGLSSEIQGEEGNILFQHTADFDQAKIVFRDGTEEVISQVQLKDTMYYEISAFIDLVKKRDFDTAAHLLQISQLVMECMDEARRQIGLDFPADQGRAL